MRASSAARALAVVVALGLLAGCSGRRNPPVQPSESSPSSTDATPLGENGATTTTPAIEGARRSEEFGDPATFFIKAAAQETDGRSVLIEEVIVADNSAWVVIHADDNNFPGRILGASRIGAGTSRDVRVSLATPIDESKRSVFAMVHLDTDGDDTFDFPTGDGPATLPGGALVAVPVPLK